MGAVTGPLDETYPSSLGDLRRYGVEDTIAPYTKPLFSNGQPRPDPQYQRLTDVGARGSSELGLDQDTDSNTDAGSEVFSEISPQSSRTSRSSSDGDEVASAYGSDAFSVHPFTSDQDRADLLRGAEQTSNQAAATWTRRQSCSKTADAAVTTTGDLCEVVDGAKSEVQATSARNARRSGGSIAPPCLKRDTDSADCFVILLIAFATKLITAIWPLSAYPPRTSSCFGAGVLPLEVFIHETLRRSKTSYSTLQVALYYLILLKDKIPNRDFTQEQPKCDDGTEASACRAMQCGRRMFLAALMLASKYLQDRNYSTRAWGKISGLRVPEINENEREYLKRINYDLHMTKETFDNWSRLVIEISKLTPVSKDAEGKGDSPRRSGSGPDAILANMVLDSALPRTHVDNGIYTQQWWKELLKRLVPDVVTSSEKTDIFIRDYFPLNDIAVSPLNVPLSTSPTVMHSASPAAAGGDTFGSKPSSTKALSSTPVLAQSPTPSPSFMGRLPTRPHLGNLPTPQTTPRVPTASTWTPTKPECFKPRLHCSASISALRNATQSCAKFANLERCPPPQRPQPHHLPPCRSLTRPAASSQSSALSRSSTPASSSPTISVLSETSSMRSRSSSISSTTSRQSMPADSHMNNTAVYSSPLSSATSIPEHSVSLTDTPKATSKVQSLRIQPSELSHGLAFHHRVDQALSTKSRNSAQRGSAVASDEGYFSGEERVKRFGHAWVRQSEDMTAAACLMALSQNMPPTLGQDQYVHTSPQRGHKRTISRTDDQTQQCAQRLLESNANNWLGSIAEDSLMTTYHQQAGKQQQLSNMAWAEPKQPLPVPFRHKRQAMSCNLQKHSAAPERAARYLREEIMAT